MASKTKKFLLGFLTVLFMITALFSAVRVVWNLAEGRKLTIARKTITERGIPVRFKDMLPDCPESQNATSLLKAAGALVAREDIRVYHDALPVLSEGHLPGGEPGARLNDPPQKYAMAIELLKEAARQKCFRTNDPDTPFSERSISEALGTLKVNRIFAVETALLANKGQIEDALDQCRIGFRLSRMLLDEPSLMSGLIAIACSRSSAAALTFVLHRVDIPAGLMNDWIKELDPVVFRKRFASVISGERAGLLESGEFTPENGSDAPRPNRFWVWLARPLIKAQTRFLLSYYDDLEKIAQKPYSDQLPFHENFEQMIGKKPLLLRLFPSVITDYRSAFLKEAVLESVFSTIRTGLACRLYNAKYGKYPGNLEALAPEFLPEVPIDPFTGKPLVYKLENGLPLIYSLGSNQKDDGGQSTYAIYELVAQKDDDWTWRETVLR